MAHRRTSAPTPPRQAIAAGYKRLAFNDDFNSSSTISPNRAGNFNWYQAVQGNPTWTVSNSELVMTADPTPNGGGFSTVITEVKSLPDSSVFRYAYFEAKMKYSNTNPFSFNPQTSRWPSFWSTNSNWRNRTVNFQEIDFQEAIPMGGTSTNKPAGSTVQFPQSTHTWPANFGSGEISPSNTFPVATNVPAIPGGNPGCDFSVYHRYGMLWTPNSIQFFFDDVGYQTIDVSRGAGGTGGLGANPDGYNLECAGDPLLVIIGTGAAWPCTWDWVRVWQRPLTSGSEFLPNASMTGGANGSPGTMPTSMATTNLGLTRTISSVGTTDPVTGLPSTTIRWNGTTTGAGNVVLYFAQATATAGAVQATASVNVILTAGSTANTAGFFMEIDAYNGATFVNASFVAVGIPYNNTTFHTLTGTNGAGTTNQYVYWYFTVNGAVAIDLTLRFSGASYKLQP